MAKTPALADYVQVKPAVLLQDLTPEQRKIAVALARKLLSAMSIELPFVYVEKDDARSYTLSAKRGAVQVAVVVTTPIPK